MVRIGAEDEPVIIVDGALANPQQLVDAAALRRFTPIGPYYPGVRAALDEPFKDRFGAHIGTLAAAHLGITARWRADIFYSLVTTPPTELLPIQRLPHYDGVEDDRLAALVYLFRAGFGGTAFYRHRTTGFETVSAGRFEHFRRTLVDEVGRLGLPAARYIGDGGALFERIATFDAVFNRMLIYRGKLLHCSHLDNEGPLPADAHTGRLTLNAFLDPRV